MFRYITNPPLNGSLIKICKYFAYISYIKAYDNSCHFLAPCQLAKYSVGFTPLDDNSAIDLQDPPRTDDVDVDNNEPRLINLFYSSTDVKVSTTSLKVDFNTFVSNVGGSLGLFIGFSVLGGVFFVYDIISSKITSKD